ncbi:hypothetical protein MTBBW1_2200031 [Desulfamplus magnetovallimortis]|uniref:Prepilin-type N-terminal cleavage/methylation domain-containing protein n=1 Tax=Desulfamplus magnetovallimortis TaxID=1246637 RepID=A0A1W1HD01_9BACT|nr:type II secretion system protein [Desulfamplus magnetovallimortis]SLM30377.1 hypothetical protein MTBBW1_2200031 [Desulfamplus magnetovallimortis]
MKNKLPLVSSISASSYESQISFYGKRTLQDNSSKRLMRESSGKRLMRESSGKCLMRESSGFTLIEVIVAMVLVSMVTLIMAVSLRITMQAWERGVDEGEKTQIKLVLPALMERQLRFLVTSFSFSGYLSAASGGVKESLEFVKKDNIFSFYTLYSPQGTPSGGLMRVVYIYDPDGKRLEIYENIISSVEDIEQSDSLAKSGSLKSGSAGSKKKSSGTGKDHEMETLSVITDVERFNVLFTSPPDSRERGLSLSASASSSASASNASYTSGSSAFAKIDKESFQETWDDPTIVPEFVKLQFAQTQKDLNNDTFWLFRTGGEIL